VAIDNPSFVPSVSCLTISSYLWNEVRTADILSQAQNLPSNGCGGFSHLYNFWDQIQVTRDCRYCGEHQGYPLLNESSILVQEFDFVNFMQLPLETPSQRAIAPPRALLYAYPVVLSIPSAPPLASCASTHLRYAFSI